MKLKFLVSLLCAGSIFASFAQGYKDGVEYTKVNLLDKGQTLLERNLNNAETDKAVSYYFLGQIANKKGDVVKAKECFDNGIAVNADSPLNYVGLAFLKIKAGSVEKEYKDLLKTAEKLGKKDAEVFVEIARAFYEADPVKYAKDIENYIKKAKKTDKKNPEAYVFEGDVLTAKKQWGDAAGYYEMALSFDPNYVPAYVKYANTYFNVSPQAAIERLEQLVSIKPESAMAMNQLAEKLYENDQWTKAAEVYGEYIKNPNHFKEDEERYAVLLYFGEKYEDSYALAEKIQNNQGSFLMRRIMFLNKAAMEDYTAAETLANNFFASASTTDRFSSNDYVTFGEVLKKLGKTQEAIAQYEKAVEINPKKVDLLKDLSSAYGANENYEKSAEYYQKYVDTAEESTNDLYVLAGKYQNVVATEKEDSVKRQAALDNALKYIDIVIEKVPNDFRIRQRKARILGVAEASQKEARAVEPYNQMLEILDRDPENKTKRADAYMEAYNYIAGCHLVNGNVPEAKIWYNKYLELDPQNEALRTYIEGLKE